MKKILLTLLTILTLSGCDQMTARNFGGDYTHELPKGEKLVNVTWKDDDLWILTRPFEDGDKEEEYKFQESSVFGVMEGTVTIVESRE